METNDTEPTGSAESLLTGSATYCPEDNKLRLYIGRVPRDEYLKLKAEGWQALYKQRESGGGDFAAIWTPERRDTALEYAGVIEDEDMGPAERAADRAERFAMYREKRTSEAIGRADRFDAGPQAHGYQSQARAERAARRHDAIAGRAVDAWSKAEYWHSRTAGVISHALHVAAPAVRMGRIKTIEAELRKVRAGIEERTDRFKKWQEIAKMTDAALQTKFARIFAGAMWGDYTHPSTGKKESLYRIAEDETVTGAQIAALWLAAHSEPAQANDWTRHLELRLAYENQMIEAQGGRAAFVEMEAGGWLGSRQIRKVNKSNVTGRVVSVEVMGKQSGFSKASGHTRQETWACPVVVNVERLGVDVYRPPTEEDKAALAATFKAEKAARPKGEPCPLINPTEAEALKLQALLNAAERSQYAKPSAPVVMTFAQYSGRGAVTTICEDGTEHRSRYGSNITRCDVFKVRTIYGDNYSARRVVILSDKPQKAFPWEALAAAKAKQPSLEKMTPRLAELAALVADISGDYRPRTHEEQQFLSDAEYIGLLKCDCSRPQWTTAGAAAIEQHRKAAAALVS